MRKTFYRALLIVMLIVIAISANQTLIDAYAYEVEDVKTGSVLEYKNLYFQDMLTEDQKALWNEILTAYDSGKHGEIETETILSISEINEMKTKIELLRSMDRVRYADTLNDVFVYGVEHENGSSAIVDLDELKKQMEISIANEDSLIHMLNACGFNKDTTQKEACRIIHDKMMDVAYDDSHTKAGMSDFFRGSCVCSGYARVYQAALLTVGIECRYITGIANNEEHAWNSVVLDGQELYVDVTWDSSNHCDQFFLQEKQEFGSTHMEKKQESSR